MSGAWLHKGIKKVHACEFHTVDKYICDLSYYVCDVNIKCTYRCLAEVKQRSMSEVQIHRSSRTCIIDTRNYVV